MNTRLCGWEATSRPTLGGLEVTAGGGLPRGAVSILEADRRLGRHQLFCDRMRFRRAHPPVHGHGRGGRPPTPPPAPAARPVSATVQLKPFRTRRGVARSDAGRHTDLANPWLIWAHNGPSPERGSWLDPPGLRHGRAGPGHLVVRPRPGRHHRLFRDGLGPCEPPTAPSSASGRSSTRWSCWSTTAVSRQRPGRSANSRAWPRPERRGRGLGPGSA